MKALLWFLIPLALAVAAILFLAHDSKADSPTLPKTAFLGTLQDELARADDSTTGPDLFLSTCQQAAPAAPSTNVNLIVGDSINTGAGRNHGCFTPQNEPAIAVNPLDPSNLVAGSNDYRDCCITDTTGEKRNDGGGYAYVSRDGGKSWLNIRLPGVTRLSGARGRFRVIDSAGDPSIAFGPDGTAYYANMGFSRTTSDSFILLSVSRDGGLTWGLPHVVQYDNPPAFSPMIFNDKEWVAVAPNGRVYVTWTRFVGDAYGNLQSANIVIRSSGDRGQHWGPLRTVSPRHLYSQGSQPQVAPDGTVYVAYEAASPLANYMQDAIVVARSTDQGRTWHEREVGRAYDDSNCFPIDWTSGRQILSGEEFRINSFPSFAVDPVTGAMTLAWADNRGTANCGNAPSTTAGLDLFVGATSNQVEVVTSQDGLRFSAPRAVTSGPDKSMPAVAMRAGVAVVSYYVRSPNDSPACSPDGATLGYPACLDYAYSTSRDGWATSRVLTDAPSNPFVQFGGQFFGDYTGVAIGSNGVAHAVWTDNRGGFAPNQDIFGAAFVP